MRFISCAGGTRIHYSLVQVMFDRSCEPQAGPPGLAPCRAKIRKVRAYLIKPPGYPGLGPPCKPCLPSRVAAQWHTSMEDTGLSIAGVRDAGSEPSP